MSQGARAWLPDGAFGLDAVRRALAGAVETWSLRWFTGREARITACDRRGPPDQALIVHETRVGQIILPPRGRRALLEAALAVDLAAVSLGDADRSALDMFADTIARDLLGEIGMDMPEAGPFGHFALTLRVGHADMLTLYLPAAGLATRLRQAVPSRADDKIALTRRSVALGKTTITLEAILGHGRLSLHELDDIALGDVILLDRRTADGADLLIAGQTVRVARGALGRGGDKPSLYL